ncbi:MAG: ABC transporter ATP-binding protein [Alphaproteobacteria bacterium]
MLRRLVARTADIEIDAWSMFLAYLRPAYWRLGLYALLVAAQSLLLVPVLLLVRYIFDHAIPNSDMVALVLAGALIVVVRATGGGSALLIRRQVVRIVKRAIMGLREDLLVGLYARRREELHRSDLDRLQTRIVQDSERADNLGHLLFATLLPTAISAVALVVVLFVMDWQLMTAAVLLSPLIWFGASFTGRRVKQEVTEFQGAFETFMKGVSFVLRQMDLTRTQGNEEPELLRQRGYIDGLRERGERMSFSFAFHRQVQATLTSLIAVILLVLGGAKVAWGDLSLGSLLSFYLAAGMLNGFASSLLGALPEVLAGSVALSKLAALLRAGRVQAYGGTRSIEFSGALALRSVWFGYNGGDVLRDVSLDIEAGSRIAIVGPNGAGKSTLLHLLLGLARPHAGRVLADGQPFEELDMRGLRRQIGVVMQRADFFRGSVRDNITYGVPEATPEEIDMAVRLAGADGFVARLEAGLDTELGENGVTLSGGECQRLALARALLRQPKALILDEPTNHLDVDAVAAIITDLSRLPHRPTIVVVSHDPRVMALVDRVYRISRGAIEALDQTVAAPVAHSA